MSGMGGDRRLAGFKHCSGPDLQPSLEQAGEPGIVRDHDERDGMPLFRSSSNVMMSWAVALSRFPVGSSARITEGLPISARAIATCYAGRRTGRRAVARTVGQSDPFQLLHRQFAGPATGMPR